MIESKKMLTQQLRECIVQQTVDDSLCEIVCRGLHGFMEKEDVDTDCIDIVEDDVANCEEDGHCNLLTATQSLQPVICHRDERIG